MPNLREILLARAKEPAKIHPLDRTPTEPVLPAPAHAAPKAPASQKTSLPPLHPAPRAPGNPGRTGKVGPPKPEVTQLPPLQNPRAGKVPAYLKRRQAELAEQRRRAANPPEPKPPPGYRPILRLKPGYGRRAEDRSRPIMKFWMLFLGCLRLAVADGQEEPAATRASGPRSMLQLTAMQQRTSLLSGHKLHFKRQRGRQWSEPCRHMPLLQRPACERQVDKQLLAENTWVRTDHTTPQRKASMTIKLDHD